MFSRTPSDESMRRVREYLGVHMRKNRRIELSKQPKLSLHRITTQMSRVKLTIKAPLGISSPHITVPSDIFLRNIPPQHRMKGQVPHHFQVRVRASPRKPRAEAPF